MAELTDYLWTAREMTHPYPAHEGERTRRGTVAVRKWTVTVHVPGCRFAPEKSAYEGETGYEDLAANGFGAGTRSGNRTVWRGCRTCGTSGLAQDDLRAMARRRLDIKRERDRDRNAALERQLGIDSARRSHDRAVADAQTAWLENHRAEWDAVTETASGKWVAEHPDEAALIGLAEIAEAV